MSAENGGELGKHSSHSRTMRGERVPGVPRAIEIGTGKSDRKEQLEQGSRADIYSDPRTVFVERQLVQKKRRDTLVAAHGPEEGDRRFKTEVGLLGEMVVFLDTRPSQRGPLAEFEKELTARAREAEVTGVVSRGKVLYRDLLSARHREQAAQHGSKGRYGRDPHVALGDSSHKRSGYDATNG